jgi:hypothetical protein
MTESGRQSRRSRQTDVSLLARRIDRDIPATHLLQVSQEKGGWQIGTNDCYAHDGYSLGFVVLEPTPRSVESEVAQDGSIVAKETGNGFQESEIVKPPRELRRTHGEPHSPEDLNV